MILFINIIKWLEEKNNKELIKIDALKECIRELASEYLRINNLTTSFVYDSQRSEKYESGITIVFTLSNLETERTHIGLQF